MCVFRYVEVLDKYFGSVCELDIIFNFEKAYFILDELILGGEMQVGGGGAGLVVLLHWDPPDTGTDFAGYHTSGHFLCR